MKSIRLLPIVVMAASALLALKTVGIVSGTGYTLSGMSLAMAEDVGAPSTEQIAAAQAVADSLFQNTTGSTPASGNTQVMQQTPRGVPVPVTLMEEDTERAILQRLAERRGELDALEGELDMRLSVVEAAERRIEERLAELAEIETRINGLMDTRDTEEARHFAGIVAMYESMRPADAATIFNTLDIAVLTRVSRAMNPRKLGPIMAKMTAARAQELTVLLAQVDGQAPVQSAQQDFSHLPQIMGQ